MANKKLKIMLLCAANSCRSQMAEGFARHYGKDVLEVHSAGLFASMVHPRAIAVMKEAGINISCQTSKDIDRYLLSKMDVVTTLCSHAEKSCPVIPPDIKRLHWPIGDPVGTTGSEEQIMKEFRWARDQIKEKVIKFIEEGKDAQKIS